MAQESTTDAASPIQQELQAGIEQARAACSTNGDFSSECAVAWDAVEEIQAAISHGKTDEKTFFDRHCADRPDAAECRIYDV